MLSKKEQELIDRLKASGRTVDEEKMNALFKLMIRPLTTVGVSSLEIMAWLEDEVFTAAKNIKLNSDVTAIVINPTIFDRAVAQPPKNSVSFNRKDRSVFASINIPFEVWESADYSEKVNILIVISKDSLSVIPRKYLSNIENEKLSSMFDQASHKLVRRFIN